VPKVLLASCGSLLILEIVDSHKQYCSVSFTPPSRGIFDLRKGVSPMERYLSSSPEDDSQTMEIVAKAVAILKPPQLSSATRMAEQ
jgi:hypothetical protein